jgi:hydrogenase/urease accessory protein HupE
MMLFKKILFLSLILVGTNLSSHEFSPAHLIVDEKKEGSYEATWMYPIKSIGERASLIFPEYCTALSQSPYRQGKYSIEKINLDCDSSIRGAEVKVVGLSVLNDALVTINFLDKKRFEGLMNLKNSTIKIPEIEQTFPTAYFVLGVEHLLGGPDHLLFVMGLLFIVFGWKNLLKTITAFTLAHSITLALSVLGIVKLPSGSIEALIALTIIYLAFEIDSKDKLSKTPWLMAFGFGLLHGFGFAGALSEIGIANDQLLLSLLFFNIGIEIGQLIMIPVFLLGIYLLSKIKLERITYSSASYLLGGVGSYWFIDRVIGIVI